MRTWSMLRCGRATEPTPLRARVGYRPKSNWNLCNVENAPYARGTATVRNLATHRTERSNLDNDSTAHSLLAGKKEEYNDDLPDQISKKGRPAGARKDRSTESRDVDSRQPLHISHASDPIASRNLSDWQTYVRPPGDEYFTEFDNSWILNAQRRRRRDPVKPRKPRPRLIRRRYWIAPEEAARARRNRLIISERIPGEEAIIMRSGAYLDDRVMHAIYGDCDKEVKWRPRGKLHHLCLKRAKLSRRAAPGSRIIQRDGMFITQSFYRQAIYHRHWKRNIKMFLRGLFDSEMPVRGKWSKLAVRDWDTVEAWAKSITENGDTLSAYFLAWKRVAVRKRPERWPNIALWLLLNSPREALLFLRATDHFPGPPFGMVSDCFFFLYYHRYDLFQASETVTAQFHRYLSYCLGPNKWPSLLIPQRGLRLYLSARKDSELASAFRKAMIQETYMSTPTLVMLVDRFARLGDVDNALQAFYLAHDREPRRTPFYYEEMNKRCRKLLKLDKVTTHDGVRSFTVLRKLLELGWKLDQPALNVVITNAVRIGDHDLAWEIYAFLKSLGWSGTSYTYLQLLNSAVQCLDGDKIQDILRIIRDNGLERQPHLVSKTLHAILSMYMSNPSINWSASDTFNAMLEIYCQAHSEKPLLDLGIITEPQTSPTQEEKTSPSKHSLTLMITAFVRSQRNSSVIRSTFDRFQQLALQGDEDIAPLVEDDFTYNAFMYGALRHLDLLDDIVGIVETMLRPLPETAVIRSADPPRQIQGAGPTIQTWTILLSAFMMHKKPQTALKIRDMMMKRGYKFNGVTWNVMIGGFARLQKVRETAACLKMMEREDFEPDEYTYRALNLVLDQKQLLSTLDWLDLEDAPIGGASPTSDDDDLLEVDNTGW